MPALVYTPPLPPFPLPPTASTPTPMPMPTNKHTHPDTRAHSLGSLLGCEGSTLPGLLPVARCETRLVDLGDRSLRWLRRPDGTQHLARPESARGQREFVSRHGSQPLQGTGVCVCVCVRACKLRHQCQQKQSKCTCARAVEVTRVATLTPAAAEICLCRVSP
jgi:hypothetical protein